MFIETLIPCTIVSRTLFATREEAESFRNLLGDFDDGVPTVEPVGKNFGVRMVGDDYDGNTWF